MATAQTRRSRLSEPLAGGPLNDSNDSPANFCMCLNEVLGEAYAKTQ